MKVYVKQNVYEQSLKRIEWVFHEFQGHVLCTSSGGKDSTSVMELALEVIGKLKREGKLTQDYKLKILWLDQEAEWTHTREYMERLSQRDDIDVYWMQLNMKLGTNASASDGVNYITAFDPNYDGDYCQPLSKYAYDKLYVDDKGKPVPLSELNKHRKLVDGKWVYDKEFDYIPADERRFYELFEDVQSWLTQGESYAILQGVKASESPRRALQVRWQLGYKGVTWASRGGLRKESVRFSPIYDWSKVDNFVHFNRIDCDYNEMYDVFLRFGIHPSNMRVSNIIHETAIAHSATILQEVDRDLYNRMVERLPGISTYSQLQEEAQEVELPSNFSSYEEYGRYLIEKLVHEDNRHYFTSMYEAESYKKLSVDPMNKVTLDKMVIKSILTKDIDKTKWQNQLNVLMNAKNVKEKYGNGN